MALFGALVRRAATAPGSVFCHLLQGGTHRAITAGALLRDARGVAARLRAAGVGAGDMVPIVLEHRAELYSSFVGCVLAGAVPTFLPPLTAKQHADIFRRDMAALLRRIAPACVIGSAATLPSFLAPGLAAIDVDRQEDIRPYETPRAADPNGVAFVQHSSGTTGLKKGVALTHRAVLAHVARYAQAIGLEGGDVVASWLPVYHDMGLITSFLLPAICGVPFISLDALEWTVRPAILLDAVERFAATLVWLPNFAFHHIARGAPPGQRWNLRSLRLVVNCSEPCRAAAFDAFSARFGPLPLATSYAMAEAVFAVTQSVPGRPVRPSPHPLHPATLSSGVPLAGVTLAIRDAAGEALPDGTLGEIHLRSPDLFAGYLHQPDLSAARLRDGWFATGDVGFLDGGEVFVVGRSDDVLNINGRKILAHELEDALALVPALAPGRILAWAEHDARSGATRLNVAAERAGAAPPGADAGAGGVQAAIRQAAMAVCMVRPHTVLLLDRGVLVKSTSGKLARRASLERVRALHPPADGGDPP